MLTRNRLTNHELGMDRESLARSFTDHIELTLGKDEYSATQRDFLLGLAYSIRDRLCQRWTHTQQRYFRSAARRVYYLSLEFLTGRLLDNAILNLGGDEEARAALKAMGLDLDELAALEEEPGLGNGGLGRLAACFLDSMASLGIPAIGYGIRYKHGIFRQVIVDGAQVEQADNWLTFPNPWELARPERLYPIHFGGHVEARKSAGESKDASPAAALIAGTTVARSWVHSEMVMAMAYDTPVPGYRNDIVNTLRLWSAKATLELDIERFSEGDYVAAVREKDASENLTRVLYPNDQVAAGRELRLRQEYFFVSATLQDALARHLAASPTVDDLPERAVFQLNDTHPAVAVPEMMRLLIDEHGKTWAEAWSITTRLFAYTNHTVLGEALECWPVWLFERLLPRHMEIIYEINKHFLEEIRAHFPHDESRVRRMSLIDEDGERRIRMAHLAVVGSFSVNGVSQLHGKILEERLFADFAELWPDKFSAHTNGITPRRWLRHCNPMLSELITARIGDGWVKDLRQLERLAPLADDDLFRAEWRTAHQACKVRLADFLEQSLGTRLDPASMFDVQIKRIHEYKRQLLALLHVVALHRGLKRGERDRVPRSVLFAGKAAPGYAMAKSIVRLISDVGHVLNNDPETSPYLKVLFVPNYSVSLAELIVPAADLSEQISTAGLEASGTGCMKLALNGALTIGTLDGANIEIRDAVGDDNIFIFGLTDPEVQARRATYDPKQALEGDPELADVLQAIAAGDYSPQDRGHPAYIVERLLAHDPYFVLADFAAYRDCQRRVDVAFRDIEGWTRKSIANVAHMGRFSSDETIAGYARDIWKVKAQ